jgi:hypothetical protein
MKRSTARWTTAFAAAAWLAVPASGWSQSQPKPATTPSSAQQPAAGANAQQDAAQEHVRQAQAAVNDIPAASIPAAAKAKFTQLKKHLSALEKAGSTAAAPKSGSTTAPQSGSTTARSKSNWASEVAAIDKILTELLGPATTSATGEPTGATGTAGQTGTTKSKSATTLTLEEPVKTKLMAVRTHVTQFAAAMSGSGGAAPDAAAPQASEPAAAQAAPPAASTTAAPQSSASTSPQSSTAAPAEQMQQQAAAQQPATEQQQQPAQGAAPQVDVDTSRRHLIAARDTLSQLTQLPAAAQLTGDTRTQVSQLITNFNELASNSTNWRESFDKVDANLTALIGPADTAAAAPSPAPAPAPTGTPGAVGTTGATSGTLDPAIRAKLVEMRTHLTEFEKAAGGSASESASTPSTASAPSATPSTTATPSSTMTTPSSTTPSSTASTTPPSSTPSPAPPATTTPEPSAANQQSTPAAQAPTASTAAAQTPDSAIRHIEAIEAMLNGQGTIGRAQVEQIRTHLAEIRKIVEKK